METASCDSRNCGEYRGEAGVPSSGDVSTFPVPVQLEVIPASLTAISDGSYDGKPHVILFFENGRDVAPIAITVAQAEWLREVLSRLLVCSSSPCLPSEGSN